jgi:hypothetical protein
MRTLLLLILFFACHFSFGQVMFQKIYGSGSPSLGGTVLTTSDGGYVVCGFDGSALCLIKTNVFGDTLWTRSYDNVGTNQYGPSVDETNDGGFITTGMVWGYNGPCLVKVDSLGNTQWSEVWPPGAEWTYPTVVKQLTNGNYIFLATQESLLNATINETRVDVNGNMISSITSDYSHSTSLMNNGAYSMVQTAAGSVAYCGYVDSNYTYSKLFITGPGFAKTYSATGIDYIAYSIIQTTDGKFAVCGVGNGNFLVLKINSNGSLLWCKTYGVGTANSLKQTSDGGLIIAGSLATADSNDVYLVKTDASGNIIWSKTYGGGGNDYGYSVDIASDSGYIVTGSTTSFGSGGIYLIKTDRNGNSGCHQSIPSPVINNPALTVANALHGAWSGLPQDTIAIVTGNINSDSTLCFLNCSLSVSVTSPGILCYGDSTYATAIPTGGTGPYTYTWTPTGDTTATINNLNGGNYTVTVFDSVGCSATQTILITEPAPVIANAQVLNNVLCNGSNSGNVNVIASGGTAPYTYQWSPVGCMGATCSSLVAGCYTVSVSDANGCTAIDSVCVTEPDSIVVSVCFQLNELCFGDSSGCAAFCATGGTPGYTYMWSTIPPSYQDTLCSLLPGQYTVTVFDANGCTADAYTTITQPLPVIASLSVTDATCSSCCDGFIEVDSVSGGVGGYTYDWSPVPSTADSIGALCAGVYTAQAFILVVLWT